ncbi:MAG: DUF1080 domain-containing protein [Kofleriaceae bacterium]|nr:DUF1080 domain-containing protein [Kofleriaceae bacterium]
MRPSRNILLSVAAASLALQCSCGDNAAAWTSLFNGSDLAGWSGDPSVWRAEPGYITGKSQAVARNTHLIYAGEFSDFELQAKVMVLNAGSFPNSGIFYRAQITDAAAWQINGYQSDVGINYWGSLYEDARGELVAPLPAAQAVARDGDWNDYRIVAQGNSLRHEINGVTAVDFVDSDPQQRRTGVIALQYHQPGEGFEVRYTDIQIRELSSE